MEGKLDMTSNRVSTKGKKHKPDISSPSPATHHKSARAAQARAARVLLKTQRTFDRSQRKVARLRVKLHRAEARMAGLAAQVGAAQTTMIASAAIVTAEPEATPQPIIVLPGDDVASHSAHADPISAAHSDTAGAE